jgi:anti-sigma B factor antagonist
MNFSKTTKGSSLIIAINEENLDIGNSVEFREGLSKEVEDGKDTIILDMSKVNYIDSSGLGVLITFLKFNKDANRTLKLANCKPKVRDTMKSTKLDSEIPLFDSIDDALK